MFFSSIILNLYLDYIYNILKVHFKHISHFIHLHSYSIQYSPHNINLCIHKFIFRTKIYTPPISLSSQSSALKSPNSFSINLSSCSILQSFIPLVYFHYLNHHSTPPYFNLFLYKFIFCTTISTPLHPSLTSLFTSLSSAPQSPENPRNNEAFTRNQSDT